jgi:hypothetical protein
VLVADTSQLKNSAKVGKGAHLLAHAWAPQSPPTHPPTHPQDALSLLHEHSELELEALNQTKAVLQESRHHFEALHVGQRRALELQAEALHQAEALGLGQQEMNEVGSSHLWLMDAWINLAVAENASFHLVGVSICALVRWGHLCSQARACNVTSLAAHGNGPGVARTAFWLCL